jgi:hypothetical protein
VIVPLDGAAFVNWHEEQGMIEMVNGYGRMTFAVPFARPPMCGEVSFPGGKVIVSNLSFSTDKNHVTIHAPRKEATVPFECIGPNAVKKNL